MRKTGLGKLGEEGSGGGLGQAKGRVQGGLGVRGSGRRGKGEGRAASAGLVEEARTASVAALGILSRGGVARGQPLGVCGGGGGGALLFPIEWSSPVCSAQARAPPSLPQPIPLIPRPRTQWGSRLVWGLGAQLLGPLLPLSPAQSRAGAEATLSVHCA